MTDKIDELIEAGEKATKGEWDLNGNIEGKPEYSVFVQWGDKFARLFGILIPEYHRNKNKGWEEAHRNAVFITKAANSREAIKQLRQERDALRELLRELGKQVIADGLHKKQRYGIIIERARKVFKKGGEG
jgi:hypothetical protein